MVILSEIVKVIGQLFSWWVIVNPWEQGIRTRAGKYVKLLDPGWYVRIPFIDSCYVQTVRIRVISFSPQTVTSQDEKTITVTSSMGYVIKDMLKLFNSLNNPERTLGNILQGHIAEYISTHNVEDITPGKIEVFLRDVFSKSDYGLQFEYIKLTGFAIVRTYRIIQDGSWSDDNLLLDLKR